MNYTSDNRIKKNIRSTTSGLSLFRQLPSRTYEYVDDLNRPTGDQIGYIAQEVQGVIPGAVQSHFALAPTEYRELASPQWSQVSVDTWKLTIADLTGTGTYRIYYNNRSKYWEVATLADDPKSFHIQTAAPPTGGLFLYGKYVADLLHIDKDKIFSVLYAATEEIDRLQQQHATTIAQHANTIAQHTARLASLEARIAALE